jgi:hypothetical protein
MLLLNGSLGGKPSAGGERRRVSIGVASLLWSLLVFLLEIEEKKNSIGKF